MQHTHKRKRTIASSGTYSDVVDDLTHILAKRNKAATIIQQSATSSSSSSSHHEQQQEQQQQQKHDKKVANNHHHSHNNEKKQKNTDDWIQQLKQQQQQQQQQYNNLHDKVIEMIANHYHPESSLSSSSLSFDSQLFNHIISGRSIQLQEQPEQPHFLSMSSSSSLTMTMNTLFLSFAHLMFKHNIQYESHGVMCLIVLPNDSSVLYWYQHLMNHFIAYYSSSSSNESEDHKDNDMLGMIMANHGEYHNNNNNTNNNNKNHLKSRIIMCSESSLDHLLSSLSSNVQEQQNDKDNNNNNKNNTVVEQIKFNGLKCLVHLTSSQQQQQQATIVASKISQLNPWKKQYIANYDMKTIASSLNFNLSSIVSFHCSNNDTDDDDDSTNGDKDGSRNNNNRKYEMEEHIVPFNDKLLSLYYLLNDWTVAESNQDKKKKKQMKQKHKRVIVLFDNEYMLMYVYYALQRLYKCLLGQSSSSLSSSSYSSDNPKTKHNAKHRAPYLFVKSIDYHQPPLQKKNKKRTAGGGGVAVASSPFAYTNDNQFNDILSFIHSKQSSVLFATAGSIAALPVIHNASDTIMILYDQPVDNNKCSIIPVIALCETQPFDDRYNCTRSDHSHLTLIIQKQIQKSKLIQKYMQLLVSHLNEYAHFQSFAVDHAHLATRSTQLKPIIEQWLRSLCISETNYPLYLDALQNNVKQVVDKKNRDAKKQESLSL